jgi:hypothetical protein
MANWTLVYATNENGVRTAGSLEELHLAATQGGDIKVACSAGLDILETRYCASVSAWIGSEGEKVVAATYAHAIATVPFPGKVALAVADPLQLEYLVYNSGGFRSLARLTVVIDGKDGTELFTVETELLRAMPLRWYARDYSVPPFRWLRDLVGRVTGLSRRES